MRKLGVELLFSAASRVFFLAILGLATGGCDDEQASGTAGSDAGSVEEGRGDADSPPGLPMGGRFGGGTADADTYLPIVTPGEVLRTDPNLGGSDVGLIVPNPALPATGPLSFSLYGWLSKRLVIGECATLRVILNTSGTDVTPLSRWEIPQDASVRIEHQDKTVRVCGYRAGPTTIVVSLLSGGNVVTKTEIVEVSGDGGRPFRIDPDFLPLDPGRIAWVRAFATTPSGATEDVSRLVEWSATPGVSFGVLPDGGSVACGVTAPCPPRGARVWVRPTRPGRLSLFARLGTYTTAAEIVSDPALTSGWRISVDPPESRFVRGADFGVTATLFMPNGRMADVTRTALWSLLERPPGIDIREGFPTSCVRAGQHELEAAVLGVSARATVTCIEPKLYDVPNGPQLPAPIAGFVAVRTTPDQIWQDPGYSIRVSAGSALSLVFVLRHSYVNQIESLAPAAVFTSNNPRVAQVDGGLVTVLAPGVAIITATAEGYTDAVAIDAQ